MLAPTGVKPFPCLKYFSSLQPIFRSSKYTNFMKIGQAVSEELNKTNNVTKDA